ncbi:MAG: asparagine synthase-related protein [Acidobacteriota bacterium]
MPGLFGIVTRTPRPLDRERATSTLDAMANRLAHVGGETVERRLDLARGVAVARIGMPGLQPVPWPHAQEPAPLLVDGVLLPHGAQPETVVRQLDDRSDPLDLGPLDSLKGFYASMWIGPGEKRPVVLAADRRASRPLVWALTDDLLVFAPEVKALLALPGIDRSFDPAAVGIFMASGFVLAHQTLFRGVQRIEGGTALVLADNEPTIEKIWTYRCHTDGDPYEQLEEELAATLRRVVERNYDDPSSDIVFLSGGRDSRVILGKASEIAHAREGQVRTVTWGADPGSDDSDVAVAQRLAAHTGSEHRFFPRQLDDYARHATTLTWILDGLSDIGAFHGWEWVIMQELVKTGAKRVLRGDQVFSRGRNMSSPEFAILRMCIRSASQPAGLDSAFRAEHRGATQAASDAELARLAAAYTGREANNVGDEVYIRHRLQGYLNTAVYFKTLILDHRNPLLDEDVLDLHERISVADRHDQKLFRAAAGRAFPELWNLPFAATHNLESFGALLATNTPVRDHVARQLDDTTSPVWDLLDRQALRARLDAMQSTPGRRKLRDLAFTRFKVTTRDLVAKIPRLDTKIRNTYLRRLNRPHEMLLRAVVLKQVADLYQASDASMASFESYLAS